jgi:hypothetical protein
MSKRGHRDLFLKLFAGVLSLFLLCSGVVAAEGEGNGASQLRWFIDRQVGGIQKLMVPSRDADPPRRGLPTGALTRSSR